MQQEKLWLLAQVPELDVATLSTTIESPFGSKKKSEKTIILDILNALRPLGN